jgi:hypothetical protein
MLDDYELPGPWKSSYFDTLGILDHCRELQVIYDELRRVKNSTDEPLLPKDRIKEFVLRKSFIKEATDLFLILGEYLFRALPEADIGEKLLQKRLNKFWVLYGGKSDKEGV